jgi:hypothetical protein
LAADYGVAHTTLSRYFGRNEVGRQLRDARRALRAEEREATARRTAERRMEQEIRRKAKTDAALADRFSDNAPDPPSETRSPYETWLDEHDSRRPLLPEDLRSQSDELAERAVETGGGIAAVIEATGLRTLENVVRRIDPAILVRAYDNDAVTRAFAPPDCLRLRRLSPDATLMQRRATGEPLRRLARDYGVSHTKLGPRELAVQYGELVAEHNDLELFELIRAESQRRELQYASKH